MFKKVKDKKFKDYEPETIAWTREDKGQLGTPLLYSYPQQGDNIKDKRYFTVKDYERVLFYDKGELVGVLKGGIYELENKARVKGTEIVWLDISLLDIPWGVSQLNGIPTKDGCIVGLHGDLKLRINDAKIFYNDIVAGKKEWVVQDLKNWIMSLLHTSLRDIFKNYNIKQILLEDRERVINLITAKVTEEFVKYGLDLETFNIIDLKTDKETEILLKQDKEKTLVVAQVSKDALNDLINKKNDLQARLNGFNAKKSQLQDDLINDTITPTDYDKKNEQIQRFINETQGELDEIIETISRI